jgi:hypothetical protein
MRVIFIELSIKLSNYITASSVLTFYAVRLPAVLIASFHGLGQQMGSYISDTDQRWASCSIACFSFFSLNLLKSWKGTNGNQFHQVQVRGT